MQLEETLQIYSKRGFYLFPVNPRNKKPLIKNNLNKATISLKRQKEWLSKWPNCHWAVSLAKSGLVAVDVDVKNGGLERWKDMIEAKGEPQTLKATSKNGGLHYIFKCSPNTQYRRDMDQHFGVRSGIDIKHNGYVKVWPSDGYQWIKWKTVITSPQSWLNEIITKPSSPSLNIDFEPIFLSKEFVQRLIDELKTHELSYKEWTDCLMAIHSNFPNSNGLSMAKDLSSGISYQEGDYDKVISKWHGFKADKSDGITIKTLVHIAQEKSGQTFRPTASEDFDAFEKLDEHRKSLLQQKEGWIDQGHQKVSWNQDYIVEWFNKEGYAHFRDGKSTPFLKIENVDGSLKLYHLAQKNLQIETKPYVFTYTRNEAQRLEEAYRVWERSIRRKVIDAIVFKPPHRVKERELNLFSGIQCKPTQGAPSFILRLVEDSLCNGEHQKSSFVLDWLAHLVQKPFERTSVALVFVGPQGTGKGMLMDNVMSQILKDYFIQSDISALSNRFNHHLSAKLLTFFDETTSTGLHSKEHSILKRLIGSPTFSSEIKHGPTLTIENFSRYILASNNLNSVLIEASNRRFTVIESEGKYAKDAKFFDPIGKAIDNGHEVNKFYNFLLERDISSFNPNKMLKTTDGTIAKVESNGSICKFWYEIFNHAPSKIWHSQFGLNMKEAYLAYKASSIEMEDQTRFWTRTKSFMPLLKKRTCSRPTMESGDRQRFISITPKEACEDFSSHLSIEFPSSFCEAGYFMEESI